MRLLVLVSGLLVLDLLRSAWQVRKAYKSFYRQHANKPDRSYAKIGAGRLFHMAIVGDSTFDVHASSQLVYGPAQVLVDALMKRRRVEVQCLASAGAKTKDIIELQLPRLDNNKQLDLVVVYMGANDLVTGRLPSKVVRAYDQLLKITERRKVPVLACELANYWHFSLLPVVYRFWLFLVVRITNRRIKQRVNASQYATMVSISQMHRGLHRNRRRKPYLLDGFHPNDESSRRWGEVMLSHAQQDLKTKSIFTDIID